MANVFPPSAPQQAQSQGQAPKNSIYDKIVTPQTYPA